MIRDSPVCRELDGVVATDNALLHYGSSALRKIHLISACILIRTERGRMEELAKKLRQIPEIKRAFPVLGRYDIVADVEAANSKQLARAVTKTMRLGGIVFTETLPEVEM
ncbi:MAG TPA: Lrp/AsnC ligand binding domain-containing protein [Nitrososphaerales archaeon]|nr:Lrp/AsnC ligand binding domain-containing protein [Nitrososphaerales archaeon]